MSRKKNKVIIQEVAAKVNDYEPQFATHASTPKTSTRRNAASTVERTNRFSNIEDGLIPFKYSSSGVTNSGNIDVRDVVILCQKAYYNFSVFRNIIDLMTEFSVSNIFFKGGSAKSREFFAALLKKLGDKGLQDRFFREYYRSGNVFVYKYEGRVQQEDLVKLTQTFGSDASADLTLPIRYSILNPADIQVGGNIAFTSAIYYKVLSDYELRRLKSPQTDEEKELFNSLPPEVKKQITSSGVIVLLPLDLDKITAVFYKKQDYEPFAVPMGYPVLEDINWKAEMKKMDMAITRTMQQAILLITMGAEPDKGGVNQKHLDAMRVFFENESVGRVLIADYTTKAQFVIPDIANLLDPKKYEQVDRDIQLGLNNVLIGDEKFANQYIKVKIFIERLKQAREAFLNDFLIPEIKEIAKNLGFKNYPNPFFEDIDLQDVAEYNRIITRLSEIGVLTPEETFNAFETGVLPQNEDSIESQRKFKALKDEGLYQPIVGGPADQKALAKQNGDQQMEIAKVSGEQQMQIAQQKAAMTPKVAGRPTGAKRKQSTKKVSPVGASYSVTKLKDNLLLVADLENHVEMGLLKKYKLTSLSDEQKKAAESLTELIITHEDPANWLDKVKAYIKNPVGENEARAKEIDEVAYEHQLNGYLAGILYASKI